MKSTRAFEIFCEKGEGIDRVANELELVGTQIPGQEACARLRENDVSREHDRRDQAVD